MLPRAHSFPWMLSLIIPFCYGLNISYTPSSNWSDFEVGLRHNWGKEKVRVVEYLCLHTSFSLIFAYLLFLISPNLPPFALSWELQTHIFSFIMLKSKVLFQHVFPMDQCGYQRAVFVCTLQTKHKRSPAFFFTDCKTIYCVYAWFPKSLCPLRLKGSPEIRIFVSTGNWGVPHQYRKTIQRWRYFGETEEMQA